MPKIGIIIGSTRPGRNAEAVAKWVHELASKRTDAEFELIDLVDYNLPVLDEPYPAVFQNYTHEHTKKWSKKIAEMDGFIFVTPEYNHAVGGALKNAIDFLNVEWNNKAVGFVSYGSAMVAEGFIALVWAAAGTSFYNGAPGLVTALADLGGQGGVVFDVSFKLLGSFGGALAILGVIVAPITTGDTAFRAARLTLADALKFDQKPLKNRLMLSIPLLFIGWALTQGVNYQIIWRYFSWTNQTLAAISLWMVTTYLVKEKINFWPAVLPAIFMTSVSATYILQAPEGFALATSISYPLGLLIAMSITALFFYKIVFNKEAKAA